MTYIQKSYEELFMNLLNHSHDNQLISHNELFTDYVKSKKDISSYYVMTLSIIADSEEDIYYDMTDVYGSSKVVYAEGTDLDDIGDIIGCPRPDATKSLAELQFTLKTPTKEFHTLPAGTMVSTKGGTKYYTMNPCTIPIGATSFTASALSGKVGYDSHVASETLTVLDNEVLVDGGVNLNLSVTNPKSSSGGREAFDDDEYRSLLMEWVENNVRGSLAAFNKYFVNLDGLDSYKLIPLWDGSGTIKIVLDPGTPDQLQRVYNDLKGSVCQLDDDIVLFRPEEVRLKVQATCNVDIDEVNPYSDSEKDEIKSSIVEAILLYVNGDGYDYTGLGIGEDFIPYQLGVFISDLVPELKDIIFKYPCDEDGNIVPVSIDDEQICSIGKDDISIVMD